MKKCIEVKSGNRVGPSMGLRLPIHLTLKVPHLVGKIIEDTSISLLRIVGIKERLNSVKRYKYRSVGKLPWKPYRPVNLYFILCLSKHYFVVDSVCLEFEPSEDFPETNIDNCDELLHHLNKNNLKIWRSWPQCRIIILKIVIVDQDYLLLPHQHEWAVPCKDDIWIFLIINDQLHFPVERFPSDSSTFNNIFLISRVLNPRPWNDIRNAVWKQIGIQVFKLTPLDETK